MCFRPAETGLTAVICPECGKKVRPAQGQLPQNCPFCKSSLEDAEPAPVATAPEKPAAPNAPAAPMAPGAPMPPSAPKTPGA